jgi:hypothetical protein
MELNGEFDIKCVSGTAHESSGFSIRMVEYKAGHKGPSLGRTSKHSSEHRKPRTDRPIGSIGLQPWPRGRTRARTYTQAPNGERRQVQRRPRPALHHLLVQPKQPVPSRVHLLVSHGELAETVVLAWCERARLGAKVKYLGRRPE